MAWLVIFDRDGILETAFPPDDLVTYPEKRGFVLLGKMPEITHERRRTGLRAIPAGASLP
jgi:hypothetical protein